MQRNAVVRLSVAGTPFGATRDEFWNAYWKASPEQAHIPASESESRVSQSFGYRLSELLRGGGYNVDVTIRSVRYGSIEFLIALTGGEELLTEMFWLVLEFYAPQAFNQAAGGNAPMQAGVTHGRGGGVPGAGGVHGPSRISALAYAPVILFVLLAIATIALMMWKMESLERESIAMHHDYTHLVGKIADQNGRMISGLLLSGKLTYRTQEQMRADEEYWRKEFDSRRPEYQGIPHSLPSPEIPRATAPPPNDAHSNLPDDQKNERPAADKEIEKPSK
jgi:hypothetical protein